MSYLVLARKWRPKKFAEMVGQEHVLKALANALDSGKVHHAFLFTGTRGVGKTTIARILAKSLNCETGVSSHPCGVCSACREIDEGRFVDLLEVDAASRTKVDDTRELLDNVQYAPTRARYKVYLIDEVHMLSNHSFNALLKTLEEPPPHVKFLLATTDPQKLPMTVLSRCLQFSLKRLSAALITQRMSEIATAESLRFEPPALALVARAADGSMRDALSLMDQLIAFGGADLSEANARAMLGTIDRGRILRILEALSHADGAAVLAQTAELDRDAPDYDRALIELAALLQRIAILQVVPGAPADEAESAAAETAQLASALSPEDVQLFYQIALGGRRDLPLAPDPRIGFEMTLLRMLAFQPEERGQAAAPPPRPAGASAAGASGAAPAALTRRGPAAADGQPVRAAAAAAPLDVAPAAAHIDAASWPQVVEAAQLSGMVRQFALNCVPVSFDQQVLKLALDAAAADRRTPQLEDRLVQGLSKYLQRPLRIQIEVTEAEVMTPARQRVLEEQQRAGQAVESFEKDPAVRALRERFGASVDTASIKPNQ
jgi:DNA polymerase III subunit gamma/tau